jgi:uncharacterized protein YndB with AHSA1/START domain
MHIVKIAVGGVAAIILLFVVIGLIMPREVYVARSTFIDAPPDQVFAIVNNLRQFNEWSPWHGMDPDTRYEFFGPAEGVGARMEWASADPEVGSGRQEIVASEADRLVRIALDFGDMGPASSEFRLAPGNGGTELVWAFHTDFGFNVILRWLGPFFDGWIGPDYERGLINLKALAEADSA